MLFLFVAALTPILISAIPEGYILDVVVDCKNGTDSAELKIVSDMSLIINVDCAGTNISDQLSGLHTEKYLTVKYGPEPLPAGSTGDCYFKTPNSNTGLSLVTLNLFYGLDSSLLHNVEEMYVVSCLVNPAKTVASDSTSLTTGFHSDGIVAAASGLTWTGAISFNLVDIMGQDLNTEAIPVGKKVQLRATLSGGSGSMIVSDCFAYGNDDPSIHYPILIAGCGDGAVLGINRGFTTAGNVVYSDYFPFFSLQGNSGVQFSCNFTACTSACDGTSCLPTRKKRTADTDDNKLKIADQAEIEGNRMTSITGSNWITVASKLYICRPAEKFKNDITSRKSYKSAKEIAKYDTAMVLVFASMTLITIIVTLYMCCKNHFRAEINFENVQP